MKQDYLPIIEKWVRAFINTMNSDVKDGFAKPGEDFGDVPKGIKIIFDGYGYNHQTDNEDDINLISFAVFIHKTSLTDYFPPHESNFAYAYAKRMLEVQSRAYKKEFGKTLDSFSIGNT